MTEQLAALLEALTRETHEVTASHAGRTVTEQMSMHQLSLLLSTAKLRGMTATLTLTLSE